MSPRAGRGARLASGLLVLIALACGGAPIPSSDEPMTTHPAIDTPAPSLSALRERLRPRLSCFADDPGCCPPDERLDAALSQVLAERHGGVAPTGERELERVIGSASSAVRAWQGSQEGIAWLEEHLRRRWASPTVSRGERGEVRVDLGPPPGRLSAQPRSSSLLYTQMEHMEGGEIETTFVARLLQEHAASAPEAPEVIVSALPLMGMTPAPVRYRYIRSLDRVILISTGTWGSPPVAGDWARYTTGRASLRSAELEACRQTRPNMSAGLPDWCRQLLSLP